MTDLNRDRQQSGALDWIFCFVAGISVGLLWSPPALTHRVEVVLEQPLPVECQFDLALPGCTIINPGRVPGEEGR